MKRTRHTPEQIIRKLREAERLLATGKELEEVCRSLEISVQTYHRWKAQSQAVPSHREQLYDPDVVAHPSTPDPIGQAVMGTAGPWTT